MAQVPSYWNALKSVNNQHLINTTNMVPNIRIQQDSLAEVHYTRYYYGAKLTKMSGLSQFSRPYFVTLLLQDSAEIVVMFALLCQKNFYQLIDLLYLSFFLFDAVVLHVIEESSCSYM